jgi:uncharacterized protein YybS (DUF2232 family)
MSYRAIIIAAIQTAALYAAGFLVPFVGQIVILFVPVPLVLLFVREGRAKGTSGLVLSLVLVAALSAGQISALLFFAAFALMAVGLAEGILRNRKAEEAVFLGGTLPFAALFLVFSLLLMKTGKGPGDVTADYLRTALNDARDVYNKMGMHDLADTVSQVSDRVIFYVVRLLPGVFLATTLLQSACCYGVAKILLRRRAPGSPIASQPPLALWHAPDNLVWGLIAALLFVVWGRYVPSGTTVYFLGLNLAIVYGLLYLVQGTAIVDYVLRRARIPALWRTVLLVLILALPAVVLLIPLGVVDIWADFRKVRRTPASA